VLSDLPRGLSFQFWNNGVLKSTSDASETTTMSDLVTLADRYKRRAEWYAERMKRYLIEESNLGNFPEYLNPGTRADTMRPYGGTFSLPIYLGEDCNGKRQRPGWNPQENLSDCC
jgi:hypothetical protein